MNRIDFLYCFEFHNQFPINQEIETMLSNLPIAISDFYSFLAFVWNAKNIQLNAESLFVKGLKKTGAERTMDLNSGTNRPLAQILILQAS